MVTCRSSIASSSADCVLGRGAIDLVGQHDVGLNGAGLIDEFARTLIVNAHARHVAGQHIGRKLDAAKLAPDRLGQRLGEHGFAHAGHVFNEQVALTQQTDDGEFERGLLADNHFADVIDELRRNRFRIRHACDSVKWKWPTVGRRGFSPCRR